MPETHHRLTSAHLGNERSIWLRPPRSRIPDRPVQLVAFLDAERYRDPAPRVDVLPLLDELVAAGTLTDTFFVFVSEHSAEARWRECPANPPFARFINEELLPWLEQLHPELRDASARVLIGLSYTGLAAAYVALQSPETWTHVISQSGSHWSNDEWLTARYRQISPPLSTRFYLDVGLRETDENVRHREDVLQVASQIDAVRRFRDALRATGHEVNYVEFDGGHDYAAWRQTLPGALRWALPRPPLPRPEPAPITRHANVSTPDKITLRPAADVDLPFLEHLRELTLRAVVENHYAWDAERQRQRVRLHWESAQIIRLGDQDIGLFKAVPQSGEIHLSQVQLLPAYQGRGIATHLIAGLRRDAACTNRPITLHVFKSNRAISLYLRLGFITTQEDQHSLTMVWRASAPAGVHHTVDRPVT